MATRTFAEYMNRVQLLVKGLEGREENLPAGITKQQVADLAKLNAKAGTENAEQEKLKALLKEKTAQLDATTDEMIKTYTLLKKYIKLSVPQELWRGFGIEDKNNVSIKTALVACSFCIFYK